MKNLIILIMVVLSSCYSESQILWEQVREANEYIYSVDCSDENNCIALSHISRYKRLLRTQNGGLDWTNFYDDQNQPGKPIPLTSENLSYPEQNKVFIASADAKLLIYKLDTDIIDTVIFERENGKVYHAIQDVYMVDDNIGIVGTPLYIFFTSDGWKSYKEIIIPEELIPEGYYVSIGRYYTNFIYAFDKDNFIIQIVFFNKINDNFSKQKTVIARTSDAGDSWIFFTLSNTLEIGEPNSLIQHIYFSDFNNGWAVVKKDTEIKDTYESLIYKTTDSGLEWEIAYHSTDTNFRLRNIAFKDYQNGIAVGANGTILTTYDGGVTWNNETPVDSTIKKNRSYQYVTFAGENPILVTSADGIYMGKYSTSVKSKEAKDLGIYPNPAFSFITLSEQSNQHYERYEIYDITGRKLQNELLSSYRIDISGLEQGTYYLRLYNSSGLSVTTGFVKIDN
jgi:hypothetical protein